MCCEVVKSFVDFVNFQNVQVLINQLKDVAPAIQDSIAELTEEVNSISSNLPLLVKLRSTSPVQAQNSGRALVSLFVLLHSLLKFTSS